MPGGVIELAEFFIRAEYRRQGIDTGAARLVFRRHPDPWRVRQFAGYAAARDFWLRAAAPFAPVLQRVPDDPRFGSEQRITVPAR
jgi:predicted acetyltransferase